MDPSSRYELRYERGRRATRILEVTGSGPDGAGRINGAERLADGFHPVHGSGALITGADESSEEAGGYVWHVDGEHREVMMRDEAHRSCDPGKGPPAFDVVIHDREARIGWAGLISAEGKEHVAVGHSRCPQRAYLPGEKGLPLDL